jgi:hypothetical protein
VGNLTGRAFADELCAPDSIRSGSVPMMMEHVVSP